MPVADRAAQRPERAVASNEGGGGGVGTFDHADVTEVGELPRPAVDISDEGVQRVGRFVSSAAGEKGGEFAEVTSGIDRGEQAGRRYRPDVVGGASSSCLPWCGAARIGRCGDCGAGSAERCGADRGQFRPNERDVRGPGD